MSRVLSATAFAAAALAFMLPFGVVSSCDGAEVHFTGTELVTFSVPADDAQDVELRGSLERGAGPFALAALIGTALGLVLSILGRPGAGRCAALGVVAMLSRSMRWSSSRTTETSLSASGSRSRPSSSPGLSVRYARFVAAEELGDRSGRRLAMAWLFCSRQSASSWPDPSRSSCG